MRCCIKSIIADSAKCSKVGEVDVDNNTWTASFNTSSILDLISLRLPFYTSPFSSHSLRGVAMVFLVVSLIIDGV